MNKENQIPWMQYTRGQKKFCLLFTGFFWLMFNIQMIQFPWWLMIPVGTVGNAFLIYIVLRGKAKIEARGGKWW